MPKPGSAECMCWWRLGNVLSGAAVTASSRHANARLIVCARRAGTNRRDERPRIAMPTSQADQPKRWAHRASPPAWFPAVGGDPVCHNGHGSVRWITRAKCLAAGVGQVRADCSAARFCRFDNDGAVVSRRQRLAPNSRRVGAQGITRPIAASDMSRPDISSARANLVVRAGRERISSRSRPNDRREHGSRRARRGRRYSGHG